MNMEVKLVTTYVTPLKPKPWQSGGCSGVFMEMEDVRLPYTSSILLICCGGASIEFVVEVLLLRCC
jgi:hypothetical protein